MHSFLKQKKIGFVGSGNMTKSLVSGLSLNKEINLKNIYVSNRTPLKARQLAEKFKVQFIEHVDDLFDACDIIVIAIKPQDLPEFLNTYGKNFTEDHVVLSLCAGIKLENLQGQLPDVNGVVRLMPSTTCEYGSGILGVYSDNEALASEVEEYFSSVGSVQVVENEEALDGVMISAASGVGFILEIMQIWSEWLVEMGFDEQQAGDITRMSFSGVSEMLKNSSKSFIQMQNDVTSKKGVTLAGLEMMRSSHLDEVLSKGFEAAIRRSRELEKLV